MNENVWISIKKKSLKILPEGPFHDRINSGNGLVPNRPQAIIWTNDALVYWHLCIAQPEWV